MPIGVAAAGLGAVSDGAFSVSYGSLRRVPTALLDEFFCAVAVFLFWQSPIGRPIAIAE